MKNHQFWISLVLLISFHNAKASFALEGPIESSAQREELFHNSSFEVSQDTNTEAPSPYFLTNSDFEEVKGLISTISSLEEQDDFSAIIPYVERLIPLMEETASGNQNLLLFANVFLTLCYYNVHQNDSSIPEYIKEFKDRYDLNSYVEEAVDPKEALSTILRESGSGGEEAFGLLASNGRQERLFSSMMAGSFITLYMNLADFYGSAFSRYRQVDIPSDNAQAEFLLRSAIEIGEIYLDERFTARPRASLLIVLEEQGNAAALLEQIEAVSQIDLGGLGPQLPIDDPSYQASTRAQTALAAIDLGDFERAEQLLALSSELMQMHELDARVRGLVQLANAFLYIASEQYEQAVSYLESTLSADIDDSSDWSVSQALHSMLAVAYLHEGNTDKAEDILIEVRKWTERENIPTSNTAAEQDFYLPFAILAYDNKEYEEAEKYLELIFSSSDSLSSLKRLIGRRDTARLFSFAGIVSQALGKQEAAKEYFRNSLEEVAGHIRYTLYYGSENQKRDFIDTLSRTIDPIISAQLSDPQKALNRTAYSAVLEKKGRILDFFSDSYADLTQSSDKELLEDILETRNQLSDFFFSSSSSLNSSQTLLRLSQLQEKLSSLEDQASRRVYSISDSSPELSLAGIFEQIPNNATLVEFLVYKPTITGTRFSEMFGEARYAFYLLRQDGSVKGLDLGPVAEIDPLIENFRRVVRNPGFDENDVKAAAKPLYEKVIGPLKENLGNSNHMLLSPDGAFNLVPFEALVDEENEYLVENYTLTYLTSGRDLLRLQNNADFQTDPLLLSNPNFERAGIVSSTQTATRYANLKERSWAALPGTGEETDRIAAFSQLPQSRNLQGADATEFALKQVNRPRFLHVATHGFFESRDSEEEVVIDNPLLRSGLVLSGVNVGQSGAEEDGIVSALEVSSLNLVGTQLVVLSACETGLGDLSVGEGVYGLRRALVLAGSESQLISLWRVEDESTRDLMVEYYDHLLTGAGRSEALRKTQLSMLNNEATAHPYYWAAFINSGDWRSIAEK